MKIIKHPAEWSDDDYDPDRTPWIRTDDTVYIGSPNMLHATLADLYKIPYANTGVIWDYGKPTQTVESYDDMGGGQAAVRRWLGQGEFKLGAGLNDPEIQEAKRAWDDFEGTQAMKEWDPEEYQDVKENWGWRRPFIYHPPTNTIYVGLPGNHHDNLEEEFGLGAYGGENHIYDENPYGYIADTDPPPGVASWHNPGSVGFYGNDYAKMYPHVLKALKRLYGDPSQKTQWDFGPANLAMEPIDQSGTHDMHPGIQASQRRHQQPLW